MCRFPGGFVKARIVPREFLILLVWGAAGERTLLTCSQEILLLVRGPHFENQWSSGMGPGGGVCGEFQLLVLLTVGTLSRLRKARVRPELTFPSPHLITPSLVCARIYLCAGG